MNIRDLKYLVAIAELGHFGQAAEACFISQPALSMQLKKLEQSLGVQLIERTTKAARLTAVGVILTEQARDILHLVEKMKQTAKQASDPYNGEFHLGIIPTIAPYLLPHIIPGLTKKFPKLKIYLLEERTDSLIVKLKKGELDAVLLALPIHHADLVTRPLLIEEFLLAVPTQHALAKRSHVQATDLQNKSLLLLEDGHCLRDTALEWCHRANMMEMKGFQATSLETLRYMVASNAGITLMPKLACQATDGIRYLPIQSPKPTRMIGMVWRSSSPKKIVFEAMTQHITQLLQRKKIISSAKLFPCEVD